MKLKLIMITFNIVSIFLIGCSSHLGIGYEKSYCEEHGLDYQDAGICGDPMLIYKYRKFIDSRDLAYRKAGCRQCGGR